MEANVKIGEYRLNLAEIDNRRRHKTKKIEGHLRLRKHANTQLFNTFGDGVIPFHKAGATGPTDDSTTDGKVAAPRLLMPSLERRLQSKFGFGVEAVISEVIMIGRKR